VSQLRLLHRGRLAWRATVIAGDGTAVLDAYWVRHRVPFIVKPIASSQGKGIFIVTHPKQVPMHERLIASEYLRDPLLVDGFKFGTHAQGQGPLSGPQYSQWPLGPQTSASTSP
jgi:hypothetical protein